MTPRPRFWISSLCLILSVGYASGCAPTQKDVSASPEEQSGTIGRAEFDLALQEYRQENYSQAVRDLMKLIERYPGAPVLAEAQWMLAKSYEAQREYGQALEEYERFIKNYPESEHLYEAKLRTGVLKQTVMADQPDSRGVIRAAQLGSSAFANREAFESMLQALSKDGINTLILPASQSADPLPGVFFKSEQAPVVEDLLTPILGMAHYYRMRVFASMPLREMPWLKDPQWIDVQQDPASRTLTSSRRLNLWNPAVQDYIPALYLELADYPFDGLIIEEPAGYPENEGFNETALEQFKNDFGLSISPSDLSTPAFWKWTGWKNRQVMAVLGHLVNELHTKRPKFQVGLAMSSETIVFPKEALVKYGQDLLEANQAGLDFFIFSWPPESLSPSIETVLKRLKDFIPDPSRAILRIDLDKGLQRDYDSARIADYSLAFKVSDDSPEWIQKLSSALPPSRPSP